MRKGRRLSGHFLKVEGGQIWGKQLSKDGYCWISERKWAFVVSTITQAFTEKTYRRDGLRVAAKKMWK